MARRTSWMSRGESIVVMTQNNAFDVGLESDQAK
jgi:hypothetical protein